MALLMGTNSFDVHLHEGMVLVVARSINLNGREKLLDCPDACVDRGKFVFIGHSLSRGVLHFGNQAVLDIENVDGSRGSIGQLFEERHSDHPIGTGRRRYFCTRFVAFRTHFAHLISKLVRHVR